MSFERWVIQPGTTTAARWDGMPVWHGDVVVMPVREHEQAVEALRQIAAADDAPTESEWEAAIIAAPGIAKAALDHLGGQ